MPSTKADRAAKAVRKQERQDRQRAKEADARAARRGGGKRGKADRADAPNRADGVHRDDGVDRVERAERAGRVDRSAQERTRISALPRGASAHRAAEPACRRPLFLPRGSLRRRGWTDSGIVRFLGEPDAHAPNPVVPSAARMRLYDEERVAAIEATETWRAWRVASEHRREAARIRAEERAQEHAERIARTGVYAELASHVANR
ncbi:hypothetical protein [Yinghuangia sp. YIM S09857]|uniref:hypothetical protein n=1 Tax=Yinghuangia sp. YIM S09857 TaxID=3436929 RepID=UPI003F534D52